MQRASTRIVQLAIGLGLAAVIGIPGAPSATAQPDTGWVTLLDSTHMGDWNRVGESNWRMESGAVVADKKTSKGPAYLVSKKPYKDFMIRVEFWPSDDANSGVFIRCSRPQEDR